MIIPSLSTTLILLALLCATQALSPSFLEGGVSRRGMLKQGAAATVAAVASTIQPSFVSAKEELKPKLTNLSNEELAKIITEDVVDRQFLASADLTREIYDESAMFTDEIDTYTLPKWIKGTKQLFVASKSEVTLTPNTLKVTDTEASFKFSEYLCFNIPFKPVVYLSGTLILKRDPSTGLITSYQEIWDQDVNTVLKSAKFG